MTSPFQASPKVRVNFSQCGRIPARREWLRAGKDHSAVLFVKMSQSVVRWPRNQHCWMLMVFSMSCRQAMMWCRGGPKILGCQAHLWGFQACWSVVHSQMGPSGGNSGPRKRLRLRMGRESAVLAAAEVDDEAPATVPGPSGQAREVHEPEEVFLAEGDTDTVMSEEARDLKRRGRRTHDCRPNRVGSARVAGHTRSDPGGIQENG